MRWLSTAPDHAIDMRPAQVVVQSLHIDNDPLIANTDGVRPCSQQSVHCRDELCHASIALGVSPSSAFLGNDCAGIDADSSSNVSIQNISILTGDDAIVVKATQPGGVRTCVDCLPGCKTFLVLD